MRFSISIGLVRAIAFTVIASSFALNGAKACTIDLPYPPPRVAGETDAQFNIRSRAHVARVEREEVASRPQRELRRQADLWRDAEQIVLVDEAPLRVEPSRQAPITAPRVPKQSPRAKSKRLVVPPPPPRIILIPVVRIPDLNSMSRVVEVRSWLKGTGRDRRLNFTSGRSSCGGFGGPADTRGPLLLFAPLGSIRERSLLGYIEVDKIVDPDIAAALTRARSKR
jgi:hypothetical protein